MIIILMDVLLWSTDLHPSPFAGHVHKNVSFSNSYISTHHLSSVIQRVLNSWQSKSFTAAVKPCFYLKQQKEVNVWQSVCFALQLHLRFLENRALSFVRAQGHPRFIFRHMTSKKRFNNYYLLKTFRWKMTRVASPFPFPHTDRWLH